MKEFLEIDFQVESAEMVEMLIALLDDFGYDSFQETDSGLKAYILEREFDEKQLQSLPLVNNPKNHISYQIERLENKNWNKEWETNYEPIKVDDRLYIRAPFHPEQEAYPMQLVITPKMSFGTGHHQTTRLMARLLLDLDLKGKRVLDMGTGTGILAIICEKRGAEQVDAIDNFDWAVENTRENAEINQCTRIKAEHGDAAMLAGRKYDLIVANINRNVLLEDIKHYRKSLDSGGMLLLSGFFESDSPLIEAGVSQNGGELLHCKKEDRWLACQFRIN